MSGILPYIERQGTPISSSPPLGGARLTRERRDMANQYPSQEARADIEMRVTSLQMALGIPGRTSIAADVVKDASEIYAYIKAGMEVKAVATSEATDAE